MLGLIGKIFAAFSFFYFASDFIFSNQRILNLFQKLDIKANGLLRAFSNSDKKELLKNLQERLRKFSIISFIVAIVILYFFKNEASYFILMLVFLLMIFSMLVWCADYIIEYGMSSEKERFKTFFNMNSLYICLSPILIYLLLEATDQPNKMIFFENQKELHFLKNINPLTAHVALSGMGFAAICFMPYIMSQMFVLPFYKLMVFILFSFSKLINLIEIHLNKNVFRVILAILNSIIIILG